MTVVWREPALADLERIDQWLDSFESGKPEATRKKIGAAIALLERLGDIGRPGRVAGTREIAVRKAPYLIAYQIVDDVIEVLAVYHMAQDRS